MFWVCMAWSSFSTSTANNRYLLFAEFSISCSWLPYFHMSIDKY